jgi:hypothetical protein
MNILLFIMSILYAIKEYFRTKDFTIRKVSLKYIVDNPGYGENFNDFWKDQQKTWIECPDIFTVDVTGRTFLPLPSCIQSPVLKITYIFNRKEYTYTTTDVKYEWPPKKVKNMTFTVPFKNVVLLDENDVPIKNITKEVTKCAGSRFDFHGSGSILDVIDKPYSKVRVTNIMNQQSTLVAK